MNTRRTDPHLDAAEDEAIERETNSFVEEGLRRGRPAQAEAVIDHKPGMERRTKVMFALGAIGILGILAAIAALRGGGDPPPALSPDLAALQQDAAALAAAQTATHQEVVPAADPQPAQDAAAESPAEDAPVQAAVALDAPVPVSPPADSAPAGDPSTAVPAVTEAAATTGAAAVPPPAPAGGPSAEQQRAEAEIARLRAELEAARAARRPSPAAPTRFQVVEVLEDGVVLRDGRGGTLIVPAGTAITATENRLQETSR